MPPKKTEITTLKCPKCEIEVSGPDVDSVGETMARHVAKKHGSKKK